MENQIKQIRKQNWFQKQFSSRNSQDNPHKQGAHEAAVAAAAFAIQSVEEAKITKLKSRRRKDDGRNGLVNFYGISSQFSYKRTKSAVENSKKKPIEQKTKEAERAHSAAKPSTKSSAIPVASGDHAEWYDKLKSVVACGGDTILKAN